MRPLRKASTHLFFLFLASALACSSSGSGTTGATDAGPSSTLKCGAGGLSGTARVTDAVSLGAIPGATLSAPGCTTAVADERGMVELDLAAGQVLKLDFGADGYMKTHEEATPVAGGIAGFGLFVYPAARKADLFPGFTAGSGYVWASVGGSHSDAGGCTKTDGVVVSIKGHPEVTVAYMPDQATRSASMTAMNAYGVAVLGPLPPGTYTIEGGKTGCTVGADTGKYFLYGQTVDVLPDALTEAQLSLSP